MRWRRDTRSFECRGVRWRGRRRRRLGVMEEQRTTGSEVRRGHTLVANHQVCQTLKEDKSTVSTAKDHEVCECLCIDVF